MDPDSLLYIIWDRAGRIIAFPTREEAQACMLPASPRPGVEERRFGDLVAEHPRALVRIYYQYYYAEELA